MQTDEKSAHATWREVAGQLEKSFPAVTEMMDEAEADALAYFAFPKTHRVKIHATNTLERLNKEVKRRAEVQAPSRAGKLMLNLHHLDGLNLLQRRSGAVLRQD